MYGKLLDRKAQRHAVDRIVQRYRRLGAVLLDPDVADDKLRARLLSTVPEAQLHEDQSDLANWTRGDRKARFEQTAEHHTGLNQFRMKFVDEQGEGTSPTLAALRVYRGNTARDAAASRPTHRSTSRRRRRRAVGPHRPVSTRRSPPGTPPRPPPCSGSTASRPRTASTPPTGSSDAR